MTDFEHPRENVFTIYSKSGCSYCVKAKNLLKDKNKQMHIIDCDDYLLENKEGFLDFIQNLAAGKEHRTFPIVFYNTQYIGGFTELQNKLMTFDEKDIDFFSNF